MTSPVARTRLHRRNDATHAKTRVVLPARIWETLVSAKNPDRLPKFRHHKATGQGYVVLNGLPVYLGRHDKPETLQRYHQTIAEWLACGRQLRSDPEQLTVKELIARFITHAKTYYVDAAGEPTSQIAVFRAAFKPLKQLYADSRVVEIAPLGLKAVRQRMIDHG